MATGRSLASIAREQRCDATTVGYWAEKCGLRSSRAQHAARGALSREALAELVIRDLTVREIALHVDRSPTTVRHWLRFHGLATTRAARRRKSGTAPVSTERVVEMCCSRHGAGRHVLYEGGRYRCARCNSEAVSRRRRKVKRLVIEEAGGKCRLCGYGRCPAALQFHHLDPSDKRFGLSLKGVARALDTVREEAQKCVLLCATCHAEVEAGFVCLPDRRTGRG